MPLPSQLEEYLSSLPEWNDPQRCLSLFSPFRGDRLDAPEAWDAKLSFWRRLILHAIPLGWLAEQQAEVNVSNSSINVSTDTRMNSMLSFSPVVLQNRFSRHGVSPLGLLHVVKMMMMPNQSQELITWNELWSSSLSSSTIYAPWALVKKGIMVSAKWIWTSVTNVITETFIGTDGSLFDEDDDISSGFSQLSVSDANSNSDIRCSLIAIRLVHKLAHAVLLHVQEHLAHSFVDTCFTWTEWEQLVRHVSSEKLSWAMPSDSDQLLLIRYLTSHAIDSKIRVIIHPSYIASWENLPPDLVHVSLGNVKDVNYSCKENLDMLKKIIHVKNVMHALEKQLQNIDTQTGVLDTRIKQYLLERNNKPMALQILKKKRFLLDSQGKLSVTIQTMEQILTSIQSAKDQERILTAYQSGTSALNTILSKEHMSIQSVDSIVESMADTLAEARQIEEAILTQVISDSDLSNDALQEELDALIAENEHKIPDVDDILAGLEALKIPQNEIGSSSEAGLPSQRREHLPAMKDFPM